ncbi:MAG: hypothetical protein HXY50_10745 [Ignavibacteriaceae bacterium]|nr:hypothetical protein [Ignavibacteriaceae bacterium]
MTVNIKTEISNLSKQYSYLSSTFLKEYLRKKKISSVPSTVNQYLSQLKKEKIIYDAGRGWYSNIQNTFQSESAFQNNVVNSITKDFPFLEFNCWSISQIKDYFHHQFTKDLIFIYSSFDSLSSLNDYLNANGFKVYNNPGKQMVKDYFILQSDSIILRPSISEEPKNNFSSSVEKILIDLYLEKDKLNLFDETEYKRLFYNLICSSRINMAQLLRYSSRREVKMTFVKNILMSDKFVICR